MRIVEATAGCPCTSGLPYGECCGPLLAGDRPAPTAQTLMRSRFTAFAIGDGDYLLATWEPRHRPDELDLDDAVQWYRLDITSCVRGGPFDTDGEVTFTAYYREAGRRMTMQEHSTFIRREGRWLYVSGSHPADR